MLRPILLTCAALVSAPAAAETVLLHESFVVECAANTPFEIEPGTASMACDRSQSLVFTSPGPEHDLKVELIAPATHCSTVTYFLNRPAKGETLGMSGRLSAGEGEKFLLGSGWDAGPHELDIGAVGYVDGCNSGVLGSWGVEVRISALN